MKLETILRTDYSAKQDNKEKKISAIKLETYSLKYHAVSIPSPTVPVLLQRSN